MQNEKLIQENFINYVAKNGIELKKYPELLKIYRLIHELFMLKLKYKLIKLKKL